MIYGAGKEFLDSATSEFLNLQSGCAPPFFYIEGIISGVTSLFGSSFTSTNWVIDGGVIDRKRPILPGERSNIFSSDVTIKCDNSTRRFSPNVTGSEFYDNDYLNSPVNYYAGFVNISGTALLLQRGSFILDNLKLDGRSNVAFMRLRDKFKKTLDAEIGIGVDVSGTSLQFVISGVNSTKGVLESLLITGAALTAGDLDIQTGHTSFSDLSLSQQSVAAAIGLISEAGDGFTFTDRKGKIKFIANTPVFASSTLADFTATESGTIMKTTWEQTREDRISRVVVQFLSGTDVAVESEATGITAETITIDNDAIGSSGDAIAIASRLRDRFSGQISRIKLNSVWLPSLDLNDKVEISSFIVGLNNDIFTISKINEQPTRGTMTIELSDPLNTGKFCFFSYATGAAGAGEHSAVFAGSGATESGGWQDTWGFFANDVTGFDDDGNNNNVVETGVASSGAGSTGIEAPMVFY